MTVGDRIKQLRTSINMPQNELADRVGITKQSLYKYEKNIITNIPSDKIQLIADVLETTPAYLMGWENKENSKEAGSFSEWEKKIIAAYRKADIFAKTTVHRALNLDEEFEKENSEKNFA